MTSSAYEQAVSLLERLNTRLQSPYPLRVWHLGDNETFEAPAFFSKLGEKRRGVSFATDAPGPCSEVVIGATWIVEIAYTNKSGAVEGSVLTYLTVNPNIETLSAYLRTL